MPNSTTFKWREIKSTKTEELKAAALELNVHPLALEDCINRDQRAKFEEYEGHQLLVWFMLFKDFVYEIQFLIFENEILFVPHEDPPSGESWKDFFRLNLEGKTTLQVLYQTLDRATDITWDESQKLFSQVDVFEEKMFEVDCDPLSLMNLKKQLNLLEHHIGILDAVVQHMRNFYQLKDELRWRFRDLHDHCYRIHAELTLYRSQIMTTIELYWGHQANRTNRHIKKLSLLAAVAVPLTFWASFWGMNFEALPFQSETAFHIALGVMVFSVIGTVAFLVQRGYWSD